METVKQFLQQYDLFSEREIGDLLEFGTSKTLHKSDFFIQAGEVCKTIAFVKSGIIRSFYLTEAGVDKTYCFIFPNHLLGAYSSFISGNQTHENMQAITETELILFPKEKIEWLAENNVNWLRFMKHVAESQYIELEKRIFQFQGVDAKQRYENMLADNPEYVREISVQHLASYLGITQRHLSRLRSKVAF